MRIVLPVLLLCHAAMLPAQTGGGATLVGTVKDSTGSVVAGAKVKVVNTDVTDAGAVNVMYGASGGLSPTAVPDQIWDQESSGIEGASGKGDLFGSALAWGDFCRRRGRPSRRR